MNAVLVLRSFRDSWPLLASCSVLAMGFTWLRVWVTSHIKMDAMVKFFSESLQIFQKLLPVPIEQLASPLGRVVFSFEEFGLVLLLGLWCVTRSSDCIAGRVGAGTMEMLLAQPVRRLTAVNSHTIVTLVGVLLIGAASWLGIGLGLAFSNFEDPPIWTDVAPAVLNFIALGVFVVGVGTFVSALVRSRSQAVGIVVGFYVIQIAVMIVGRVSTQFTWMQWLTIFSVYEPTLLTLGLHREPDKFWPLYWQYNFCLVGLGVLLLAVSDAIFCRRDVPAPL
jgi:ABC-type transport system involved in multi-copper enzyme maturation permease subunit